MHRVIAAYRQPAVGIVAYCLDGYVNILRQIEGSVCGAMVFLDEKCKLFQLLAAGNAVMPTGNCIRAALVKLGHGCGFIIFYIVRIRFAVYIKMRLINAFHAGIVAREQMRRVSALDSCNTGSGCVDLPIAVGRVKCKVGYPVV